MKINTSSLVMGAAIAGIIGAATSSTSVQAKETNKAEMGLCKDANNSCSGKGACGEMKGKNDCKGHGAAKMTKAKCEKMKHEWTPMADSKMEENKMDQKMDQKMEKKMEEKKDEHPAS